MLFGHHRAALNVNSQQLRQHTQDMGILNPDKLPAWIPETDTSSTHTEKAINNWQLLGEGKSFSLRA